ncbi:hypothetical protein QO003_002028 [Arthrobacter silviterrae]|uniref:Uncharacterized protein n=1 Tax=Arthrobacter silviterrae TaxID=2026658 RepID=A0ABX0DHW9_9MICC|nr:hypothetical protein [Arthrobacter silviterrae]MDQ0277725.1 hypothetical protein [Arthrobacter silviterrae]NGN84969.1 hypothetical protein [Arthrobacter silviterrae]
MPQLQTQLYSSTFWSARRPKFPLTEGHLVLRLNDPAIAFGPDSAAGLLHSYGRLRKALTAVCGATAAQLYMSLNWQPVGDAVGEPLAETSTPTLHLFFHWPGSTTAATALRLPAHQRTAAAGTEALDAELRSWLAGTERAGQEWPVEAETPFPDPLPGRRPGDPAPGQDRSWEPPGWEDRPFHIEPVRPISGEPFRVGHWTAISRFPTPSLDRLAPASVVELAGTLQGLASHSRPAAHGCTVWATDIWDAPDPATLHLFTRRRGEADGLPRDFVAAGLDLPRGAALDGNPGGPSPTVDT